MGESGGACLSTNVMRPLPLMLPMTCSPANTSINTCKRGPIKHAQPPCLFSLKAFYNTLVLLQALHDGSIQSSQKAAKKGDSLHMPE